MIYMIAEHNSLAPKLIDYDDHQLTIEPWGRSLTEVFNDGIPEPEGYQLRLRKMEHCPLFQSNKKKYISSIIECYTKLHSIGILHGYPSYDTIHIGQNGKVKLTYFALGHTKKDCYSEENWTRQKRYEIGQVFKILY